VLVADIGFGAFLAVGDRPIDWNCRHKVVVSRSWWKFEGGVISG
jgi:hypothetical protein